MKLDWCYKCVNIYYIGLRRIISCSGNFKQSAIRQSAIYEFNDTRFDVEENYCSERNIISREETLSF